MKKSSLDAYMLPDCVNYGIACANGIDAENKCVDESKLKKSKGGGLFAGLFRKKGPHSDVVGMPECSTPEDCQEKLHGLHLSVAQVYVNPRTLVQQYVRAATCMPEHTAFTRFIGSACM